MACVCLDEGAPAPQTDKCRARKGGYTHELTACTCAPDVQAVYKTFIDVVHVEKTEGARLFSVAGPASGEDSPGAAIPGVDVSQPDAAPLNTTDSSKEQREAQEARLQVRLVASLHAVEVGCVHLRFDDEVGI